MWQILLQKSKVAAPQIFRENKKRGTITDSYILNRVAETAGEFDARGSRSEVIADAMYRVMGPYAIRDIRNAIAAGRYRVEDAELAWRQATHAIVGFSLAVCDRKVGPAKIDEAVVNLLGMVGVTRDEAWEIAKRPCPELPGE